MSTANERYLDSAIRHAIGVRRLTAGEVKKIIALLDEADTDLVDRLQVTMARSTVSFTKDRIAALLKDVRGIRAALMGRLRGDVTKDLLAIAKAEVLFEERMLKTAIPFEIELARVSVDTLRTIVSQGVWNGRTTGGWFDSLKVADQQGLERALRLGLVQQEPIPDIVRRVRGTRADGFAGPLRTTRAQATTVVRTVVNGVSNAAREAVLEANPDVAQFIRWVSTLDGRTTLICMGRDGKLAPVSNFDLPLPPGSLPLVPPTARPPAHPSCRSLTVAFISPDIVGNRPFVQDARDPSRRLADFRADARRTGRPIGDIRSEWAQKHIGRVPAKTDYDTWLRTQPAAFQDRALGARWRGQAFRKGERVDRFVDRPGNTLTLDQWARTQPEIAELAGLL